MEDDLVYASSLVLGAKVIQKKVSVYLDVYTAWNEDRKEGIARFVNK